MTHEEALGLAQILLALLVFALGVPALVVETTADEHIRYILHKRSPQIPIVILMLFTLLVVAGLVWYSGFAGPPGRYASIGTQPSSIRPNDLPAERVYGHWRFVTLRYEPRSWLSRYAISIESVAKMLTVSLLGIFGAFWMTMTLIDFRSLLLWYIAERCRWRFRLKGSFADRDIEHLLTLGANSPSEYEKDQVIGRISSIAKSILAREEYSGTELTPFIAGLARIVAAKEHPASERNYAVVAEIIEQWWMTLDERMLEHKKDGATIIETAAALGVASMRAKHDTAAMAFLDSVGGNEKIAFRIGIAALAAGRYRVALAALSKLEAIAEHKQALCKELIALLAQFSLEGVHSASIAGEVRRRLNDRYSADHVRTAALLSAEEFSFTGDFASADALAAYANDYR